MTWFFYILMLSSNCYAAGAGTCDPIIVNVVGFQVDQTWCEQVRAPIVAKFGEPRVTPCEQHPVAPENLPPKRQ